MTVTLDLSPEVEGEIVARARASGVTVEAYLLAMVEGVAVPATRKALSAEERAAAFEAWSANHLATPPLSEYAVSREAMYEDREH
jgi:hypothetical protein